MPASTEESVEAGMTVFLFNLNCSLDFALISAFMASRFIRAFPKA